MKTLSKSSTKQDASAERHEVRSMWIQAVQSLADQVTLWANNHADDFNWEISSANATLTERRIGAPYDVPVLELATKDSKLVLEPIGQGTPGADGRVDFYAWPSLFRVMLLLQNDGSWIIRTDSGVDWPNPWSEGTFISLAKGLLNA